MPKFNKSLSLYINLNNKGIEVHNLILVDNISL